MPDLGKSSIPKEDPQYRLNSWVDGYNSYQPKNKIKKTQMSDAQNCEIFINTVEKRMGSQYLGNEKDSRTRGLALYTHSDSTKTIIRASGDTIQEYNVSTGDFDDVTGNTYTSDLNTDFIQAYDQLFVCNGTDNLTKYDKDDTPKITVYETVNAPTSPSATRGQGLSSGQYTAYFKLTHYNSIGETIATSEFSVAYDIHRTNWDGVTEKIDLAWTNSAGATGTNIYFSDTSGDETYLWSISGSGTSWSFLGGENEPDGITEPPETNSTAGVAAFAGCFDGVRMWLFKGSFAYYSGSGPQGIGKFDTGSGGGSFSVARGDGDEIQAIKRFRDGQVIIYKRFSTWKAEINTDGRPVLKMVNSMIGIVGKRAVAQVDDDHVLCTDYGICTLGNLPNFPTDILRVKFFSQPIDKDLEKITPSNLPYVVLHYDYKRKLRVAYAEGGSTYNNAELVFKEGHWMPNKGFNINCYCNVIDVSSGTPIIDEINKRYTLYGSDNEGRVVQFDKGYSDKGSNINAYFDTFQDDQGFPERYKKYYDQDVEIGKLQGTLDIYQYFDSGTIAKASIDNSTVGGMGAEAVGLSETGAEYGDFVANSGVSLSKRWRLNGRIQRHIKTRFQQDSASGTFSVMTLAGVYRVKSRRQYPSDDIITISEV